MIWLNRKPLSDAVKEQLSTMTEHLSEEEKEELIKKLETHLDSYIQEKEIHDNNLGAAEYKNKIKTIHNKSKALREDIQFLYDEHLLTPINLHFQDQDADNGNLSKSMSFRQFQDELPGIEDSIILLNLYSEKLLQACEEGAFTAYGKGKTEPRKWFYTQFKQALKIAGIPVPKTKRNKLYGLMMEQAGVFLSEFDEFTDPKLNKGGN